MHLNTCYMRVSSWPFGIAVKASTSLRLEQSRQSPYCSHTQSIEVPIDGSSDKSKRRKGDKDQELIQSNTTPDPRVTKIQLNILMHLQMQNDV